MTNNELRTLFRNASLRHKQLRDRCQHHSPHAMAKEFKTDTRTIAAIERTGEPPRRAKVTQSDVTEIRRRIKIYRKHEPELNATNIAAMARRHGIPKQTAYLWAAGLTSGGRQSVSDQYDRVNQLAGRFLTAASVVSRPSESWYY